MKLAAGYNPTGGNGWISSPPHHQHPSSRHHGLRLEGCYQTNMCQKSQCKWPGVYVVLHTTTIFYICILPLTNVLENAFYFLSTKNTWIYILIWTGTYHHHLVPPLLIVLWRHILWRPVPSPYNVDLVWSGIRQSLSTCGGIYNYRAEVVGGEGTLGSGGNGPIWKEVLVLESYQYSYIFIPPLQYLQYPEPEGLYVNTLQFWDIFW